MDIKARLHEARLARHLDLAALAARTALSPTVLAKIDEGRFGELPAGLYARSYVRTFAAEVGVDPGLVIRELEHIYSLPPQTRFPCFGKSRRPCRIIRGSLAGRP